MWYHDLQMFNSKDVLFNAIMQDCKSRRLDEGLCYSVRSRLEKYDVQVRKEIVSMEMDGCAPLFFACKKGQVKIVKYLITVCHADIEQRGRYEVPDDESVHFVTPLWCAAVSGQLAVLKCLISHGADVNAMSDTGSTPVRSACFMTHIDIVSCLVENGADIHKANYNGGTCLINSVQSVELCTFLLRHGADVNAIDVQNKTALHYAIQEHRLETTKLLLEHNADPHIRSRYNDDALQTACYKGAIPIFEYLVANVSYAPERLADAIELLGSTCFDESRATQAALKYWRAALVIRNANAVDGVPLPKTPVLPKREAYKNATEFTTIEELNAIALDLDAMRIQSLLICERVLGPHHKETPSRIMFRGASYADAFRYQYCIDLWRRALEIPIEKDSILCTDACFIAEALLRLMVDLNEKSLEKLRFSDVAAIMKLLSSHLAEARQFLEKRPVYKRQQDNYERILVFMTHLIYLLVRTGTSDDEKALTKQLVHQLVKQDPRSAFTEDTLLHYCVSSSNKIKRSYFAAGHDIHKVFPCYDVVKLLLDCGANVNAKGQSRKTPLHVASSASNFQNSIIALLLDYGAHLDTPDMAGDTPIRLLAENPKNNVNLVRYISLQCHAAQVIQKYGILGGGKSASYDVRKLPVTLQRFLELHRE